MRYGDLRSDEDRMRDTQVGLIRMREHMKRQAPDKLWAALDGLIDFGLPVAYVHGLQTEIMQMIGIDKVRDPVFVYLSFFGEFDRSQFLKIGVAKEVRNRIVSHRTSNPMDNPLTLAAQFESRRAAMRVEAALLQHMKPDRVNGEWIRCRASVEACRQIVESLAEVASAAIGRPVLFSDVEV